MKTCSFLDPVTSKFLLIVNIKCELPWCIWKTKPLMPYPGYFRFSVADFFLGIGFAHILAGTNLKQSECVLSLNLLVVSTFYISSLAGASCIEMLLSRGKLG